MIQHETSYEQVLRRALHAAADGIEPEADGLERIRARMTMPAPLPIAWLYAGCADVSGVTVGWMQTLSEWLRAVAVRLRGSRGGTSTPALTARREAGQRLSGLGRPAQSPRLPGGRLRLIADPITGKRTGTAPSGGPKSRSRDGWLRPLAAASAVAVVVTALGAFALTRLPGPLPSTFTSGLPFFGNSDSSSGSRGGTDGSNDNPLLSSGPGGSHHGFINPFGPVITAGSTGWPPSAAPSLPPRGAIPAPGSTPTPGPSPKPTPSPKPKPKPTPTPTPTTTSPSPSPSPTTTSPSPSSSPTVTPSGTTAASPGISSGVTG